MVFSQLMEAIMAKKKDTVLQLIRSKTIDVNQRDHYGMTALYHACRMGETDIVKALLMAGADPAIASRYGWTPKHIARLNKRNGDDPSAYRVMKVGEAYEPVTPRIYTVPSRGSDGR